MVLGTAETVSHRWASLLSGRKSPLKSSAALYVSVLTAGREACVADHSLKRCETFSTYSGYRSTTCKGPCSIGHSRRVVLS